MSLSARQARSGQPVAAQGPERRPKPDEEETEVEREEYGYISMGRPGPKPQTLDSRTPRSMYGDDRYSEFDRQLDGMHLQLWKNRQNLGGVGEMTPKHMTGGLLEPEKLGKPCDHNEYWPQRIGFERERCAKCKDIFSTGYLYECPGCGTFCCRQCRDEVRPPR